MRRVSIGVGASAVIVLLVSAAGCDSHRRNPAPAPSEATAILSPAEAQQIFERYDTVNAAADAALDATAIREVETGVQLTESLAGYQIHRKARTKDTVAHYVRPTFLIPTVADAPAFPRYFAVLSKRKGIETDRSSTVMYFTQTAAGGPWKVTAVGWVVTEAARTPTASPPSPTPSPTYSGIRVIPKVLPGLRRNASGATELSPSAATDRAICDDFADYMSFSPPSGNPTNPRFTNGSFTSEVVRYFNRLWNPRLHRSYQVQTKGEPLPVFRFADGGALVACTFERRHTLSGVGATGTVQFAGSDTDVLLGGGGREWRSVREVSSLNALIEAPAAKGSPATVLTCGCYDPQVLSATGVRT